MRKTAVKRKKADIDPDLLVTFWLKYKDYHGNPWFRPTDDGGIELNLNCQASRETFMADLRAYVDKRSK